MKKVISIFMICVFFVGLFHAFIILNNKPAGNVPSDGRLIQSELEHFDARDFIESLRGISNLYANTYDTLVDLFNTDFIGELSKFPSFEDSGSSSRMVRASRAGQGGGDFGGAGSNHPDDYESESILDKLENIISVFKWGVESIISYCSFLVYFVRFVITLVFDCLSLFAYVFRLLSDILFVPFNPAYI